MQAALILFPALMWLCANCGYAQSILTTIDVGNEPIGIGVNINTNRIYVANSGGNSVSIIDGETHKVIDTVGVGSSPAGVGVNHITNRIYVANSGASTVSVIAFSINQLLTEIEVDNIPVGVGVNTRSNQIYVTNFANNTVSVINGVANQRLDTLQVGAFPMGIAVNTATNIIYVANIDDNTVTVINGLAGSVVGAIRVGREPISVAANIVTDKIYVSNSVDNTVSVINGANQSIVNAVKVGSFPQGIGVNPTTNRIYVVNFNDDTVSVIDGTTDKVVNTFQVGEKPIGVGVNSSSNLIYISNNSSNSVTVIQDIETGTETVGPTPEPGTPSGDTQADFLANPKSGPAPLLVAFNDLSTSNEPLTKWIWDFGDGGISSLQNPKHEYSTEGLYTVTLAIENDAKETSGRVKTNHIVAAPPGSPVADFSTSLPAGEVPFVVDFTDDSISTGSITSWIWDFGDGALSTEQNPSRTYIDAGLYTVRMTAGNNAGFDTITKTNLIGAQSEAEPLFVNFSASSLSGIAPLKVDFTDDSVGPDINAWLWDFGDGGQSVDQNPSHIYKEAGVFTVNVNVSNLATTLSETKLNLIRVAEANEILAGFSANPVLGVTPFRAVFVDNSIGGITLWDWDFGDGSRSNDQNPFHIYKNPGEYSVTLTVSGESGIDSARKKDLIKVAQGIPVVITPEPTPDTSPTENPTETSSPTPDVTPTPEPTPVPTLEQLSVNPRTQKKSLLKKDASVEATDKDGRPVQGVIVRSSKRGIGVTVEPEASITDFNGKAAFRFRFGPNAKRGKAIFSAEGLTAEIRQQIDIIR